ncbi:MAG TPA: uridine kinase [Polyangia bacterium]|jgi:uridine kinase|nr:uridine kinase [Polyangia bacterium]
MNVFVLGVAGGTGSGKTTIAENVIAALPRGAAVLVESDAYYRDRSQLPRAEREHINYDHPDAIETEFLAAHLAALRAGQAVDMPQYDYREHARKRQTRHVAPAPVIVVEGILVLNDERLRAQMDLKIFVDTDADIRLMRRMRRDMEERGRTFAQVREQYFDTVRPMHLAFVEPSKRFADLIVPEGGRNQPALDAIVGRLLQTLAQP